MVRAGWSAPRLRASKLSHSASTTGPSATSQPIATKMSSISSAPVVSGCREPRGRAVDGQRDVDGLLDQHPLLVLGLEHRGPGGERLVDRAAGRPTRWPASLRACGGSAPISRLASASGERSPAWSSRTCLSSARSPAASIAASAASRGGVDVLLARAGRPGRGRSRCWVRTWLPFGPRAGPAESRRVGALTDGVAPRVRRGARTCSAAPGPSARGGKSPAVLHARSDASVASRGPRRPATRRRPGRPRRRRRRG